MIVTKIDDEGFETEEDYFRFDEVRKLYFLTKYGYEHRKEKNNALEIFYDNFN